MVACAQGRRSLGSPGRSLGTSRVLHPFLAFGCTGPQVLGLALGRNPGDLTQSWVKPQPWWGLVWPPFLVGSRFLSVEGVTGQSLMLASQDEDVLGGSRGTLVRTAHPLGTYPSRYLPSTYPAETH